MNKYFNNARTRVAGAIRDASEELTKISCDSKEQKILTAAAAVGAMSNVALAAGQADAKSLINSIIEVICFIVKIIGILWAFWGAIQFIMAQRNDDPEGKNKAAMQVGTGAVLVAAEWIVDKINITQYL